MKANAFLLTCLAIIITTSCGDKALEPTQPPNIETKLIGNWFLLESCGGIDGKCTVPYSGESVSFTTDGKIHYLCDVCFFLPYDYKIEQKTSLIYGPDTIVTVIVIFGDEPVLPELIIKSLNDSGLTVQEDCADCYESFYSRFRITNPFIVVPD